MRRVYTVSLILLLLFLTACTKKDITISFEVIEYEEIVLESIKVIKGEEVQLPVVEQDWFEFMGWYMDESYTTKVESVVSDEDITLYGKFEPSLSIALLGNPSDNQYDEIVHVVEEYSIQHGRIYQIYDTSETDPYDPIITLDAIDEAILQGAKIIILTSGFYHSEATYQAQTEYPEIHFVLIGGEPKEHTFYTEPNIAPNTLTTKPPKELCGFLAGYSAVYEGFTNLGFFNELGTSNGSAGVGFLAGAYYAADQLNIDILINDAAYKNIDHASMLVKAYYMDSALELGVELIYTFEHDDNFRIQEIANDEEIEIILALNSYNSQSESVLTILDTVKANTVRLILDGYFNGDFEGGNSIYEDYTMDLTNYSQFNLTEFSNIKNMIFDGSIVVPTDYPSLVLFFETLEVDIPTYFDEYLIEGNHSIEDIVNNGH